MRTRTITQAIAGATALTALIATPALAGKPSPPSGSLELMQPLAAASVAGSDGTSASSDLSYGENAEFIPTLYGDVSAKADVYVTLACWQGRTVVYNASEDLHTAFRLEDTQPGLGLEWDGGDASCHAWLVHRVDKGKSSEITVLDGVGFEVSGTANLSV